MADVVRTGISRAKEKAKAMRDERISRSGSSSEDYVECIDLSQSCDTAVSYTSVAVKKVLSLDFSNQSTYTQFGIGGVTGWFTGYMVGKVGKAVAAAMGGTILLLNMGTRAGYITVDWEKVDTDMRLAGETIHQKLTEQQQSSKTQQLLEKGSMFVRRNVVTVGGFATGFLLGMAT